MTGALGAIASIWLGVHDVPISIGGRELGVMPLLAVLLMIWGTARSTARATSARSSCLVGSGRPLADDGDRAGGHPRRVVGDHRTADTQRLACIHQRAGGPCHRCRGRCMDPGGSTAVGGV